MIPRPHFLIAALLGAAALTACGDDSTDESAPDTTDPMVAGTVTVT